jgi:hypothetical protein
MSLTALWATIVICGVLGVMVGIALMCLLYVAKDRSECACPVCEAEGCPRRGKEWRRKERVRDVCHVSWARG